MADVVAGGSITFGSELSGQQIELSGTLSNEKPMTIDASGLAAAADGNVGVTLNPEPSAVVLSVPEGTSGVILTSIGISGGRGINNHGELWLNDCVVSDNQRIGGGSGVSGLDGFDEGGVANWGRLTMNRCAVHGNIAGNGDSGRFSAGRGGRGGGVANHETGEMTLIDCRVFDNTAEQGGYKRHRDVLVEPPVYPQGFRGGWGGGIWNAGDLVMNRCIVEGNRSGESRSYFGFESGGAGGDGGGIGNTGVLTIRHSNVHANTAGRGHDYLATFVPAENFLLSGIAGGSGGSGGGLMNLAGFVVLEDCEITENAAGSGGTGDIYPQGGSRRGARGGSGGGIWSNGELAVVRCVIRANRAGIGGGGSAGHWARGGDGGSGGGIYAMGSPTSLIDCEVAENQAGEGGIAGCVGYDSVWMGDRGGPGGDGGGLFVDGDATIGCSVWGNMTGAGGVLNSASPQSRINPTGGGDAGRGGGVFQEDGMAIFTNTTIANNFTRLGGMVEIGELRVSGEAGDGGGFYLHQGTAELEHVTISSNESTKDGGGIMVDAGMLDITNSVIASNSAATSGFDILGAIDASNGVNLISDGAGAVGLSVADLTGLDPLLAPLGDFGEVQDGDAALVWVLDPDADGSPWGVEQAVGTDPLVADRGSSANLRIDKGEGAVLSFGRSVAALAGTIWVVGRSTNLETFEEIYRFDGATETAAAGVSSQLEAERIMVTDSDPLDGDAFYRLEALRAP